MSKTVLITGCSNGGLGAAMAKVYHAKGFRVFATIRNKAKAGSLGEIDGIEIIELEVTSVESIRQCADAVAKRTGGALDILVNNAGVNAIVPLLDASLDDAKKVYDANVWSVVAMAQAFTPMLIKAKGVMCNISSVSGEMVFAWAGTSSPHLSSMITLRIRYTYFDIGVYSSSRCAGTRISETLRLELAPLGVRVVTVILGGVQTSGNDPSNIADLELPPKSYYQKVTAVIDRHKKTVVHPNKQNIDIAAKNVVDDVLSGRGPFIRRGQASTLSWLFNTFIPYGLFIFLINRDSALDQIGFLR
jgi:NAD(P)-dependent dehydrogenase (short-subunit alcohol dehydrogenase family)